MKESRHEATPIIGTRSGIFRKKLKNLLLTSETRTMGKEINE